MGSDAVKQKRAEIKAIKEKRRKSKLVTSVSSSPSLKPSANSKRKSKVISETESVENIELKKRLKMSEFIKKKYEILKNENNLYKEQVSVLNEENEALKVELAECKREKR